ncbi:MAG: hypothetical protein EXS51_00715 [Candidatus Taylorbacteria bacterium]|nr:hypothetical protein [Candidatus Taylorbacteria bacterium]
MSDGELIGMSAGILSFAAYVLYFFSTFRGETKPNRATWWILTLVGSLIAASYYASGARDTIWVAVSYVLGPAIIAVLSLRYGEGTWERLDKICLAGALAGAVIWYLSDSAITALTINILMDFLGLIPTIKKSYLRPEGEDRAAWMLESLAGICNLFAISVWTFAIAFYPLYLLAMNATITLLLLRPRRARTAQIL